MKSVSLKILDLTLHCLQPVFLSKFNKNSGNGYKTSRWIPREKTHYKKEKRNSLPGTIIKKINKLQLYVTLFEDKNTSFKKFFLNRV